MNLDIELPDFMTTLMKRWLIQYKLDILKNLTTVGLFHWDYRPNKRKPEKPRRIPKLGQSVTLTEADFKIGVYFFEVDSKTLHVFETSGFTLAGFKIAKEYLFENKVFKEKRTLLKMIS